MAQKTKTLVFCAMRFPKLFCVFDRFGLPDHVDLDLTGIFQLRFQLSGDVPGQEDHIVLGDLLGLYHNADLPTGLDGVSLFHAGIGAGEFLQFLQAANVVFYIFPPGAGTGGGNGVVGLTQSGEARLGLLVSVVRLNGVNHCGALFVLPGQLHAQLHVAAFHFVVYGFA